jgi:hypothetical protein
LTPGPLDQPEGETLKGKIACPERRKWLKPSRLLSAETRMTR